MVVGPENRRVGKNNLELANMRSRSFAAYVLGIIVVLPPGSACRPTHRFPATEPNGVATRQSGTRIGTFQRRELLIAYYGSTIHDRIMKKLKGEWDQAQLAGDMEKVKKLEAEGGASQEYAHKQLAGEAPLNNVIEHLKDAFPKIAADSGVALIIEQPLYRDPSVKEIDVTPMLVKQFEPARKKGP
jgi:hypothetical protein